MCHLKLSPEKWSSNQGAGLFRYAAIALSINLIAELQARISERIETEVQRTKSAPELVEIR